MAAEENRSPKNSLNPPKRSAHSAGSEMKECILSPRFRSAAAMAGWDEEALVLASLVVEDTPVRESRHKKRPNQQFKSPPSTNSNRKRRSQRRSANSIPAVVLDLDDADDDDGEVAVQKDIGKGRVVMASAVVVVDEEKKMQGEGAPAEKPSGKGPACMDRLREELSCAICLEICFKPSTTLCGHSFCKKCLKCAAAKCGKRCPKCRQLISNPRSCTVNTVLWNTIQLLFPDEVEERKKAVVAAASRSGKARSRSPDGGDNIRSSGASSAARGSTTRSATRISRAGPSQSEDAALALRLQREEFMVAFQGTREQQRNTHRSNLRAIYIRSRGRST